ncbi:quinone-dependent dihydroorotate dehydrogenase [Nocardioides acrostichi]|uniref:Dihydroorotate dehydrogenase (quinone) n=1 Tax=Nocardioides acrostichi TaxID=2784339 RepID=A0A930Y8L5_9ACTN|nr:quinone-dependent dihydroorotate dehydrogenase [Nocardioides acrostichi]MBF4163191.1 quinone-dependent dihydroorotate dehydrogenase [Nocardioides acrostichi]
MTAYDRAYEWAFRHLATRVDAERAHRLGFAGIRAGAPLTSRLSRVTTAPVEAMGLSFANRLGLAAGFDKDAEGIAALAALGFGHVEIGTVTGRPQPGNPRPRLFRLPADRAVLNRMGFNNSGAEAVAHRLAVYTRRQRGSEQRIGTPRTVLGVNIGKSKVVPDDDQAAVEADYETSASLLAPYADYLVVNVSSPNTPGLRNLQAVERLEPLLAHVRAVADRASPQRRVPLLVKIAPDLADDDLDAVADLAVAGRRDAVLDGIIATNTTIGRSGLVTPAAEVEALGAGGLSGAPLTARSTAVLRRLRSRVGEEMTLVGVGGIDTGADARERVAAGATLVQGYSGFVYGGPGWPRRIVRALEEPRDRGEAGHA